MDWKKEAVDTLRQYPRKKTSIKNLTDQIAALQLKESAVRSASSDGDPVAGGGGNGREDWLLNSIVLKSALKENQRATMMWCESVERALESLDEEDRLILDRMYIHRQYGHVERLCEELHVEKSSVYDKADRAVRRFVQAYYGCATI